MKECHIDILKSTVVEKLRDHFNQFPDTGMMAVAMDHCPSEQLDGNPWHTTIFIAGAHVGAIQRFAQGLGLRKWVRASNAYKKTFLKRFFEANPEDLLVFAISAREQSIVDSIPHMLTELGAQDRYNIDPNNGKIKFGPIYRADNLQPIVYTLPSAQAPMCIFIAHCAIRVHQMMSEAINPHTKVEAHVNWDLYADRFPNSIEGSMYQTFVALMGLYRGRGGIRTTTFAEQNNTSIELLPDNLAGALDYLLRANQVIEPNGFFYWEQWQ